MLAFLICWLVAKAISFWLFTNAVGIERRAVLRHRERTVILELASIYGVVPYAEESNRSLLNRIKRAAFDGAIPR